MSIYARLRVLLALSVLVIGGSVWLIAGQQRDAVIGMQGQLRASNDLLTAMLDQETGLRGYALTGDQEFLEPYDRGQPEFEAALRNARGGPRPRARDRGAGARPHRDGAPSGRPTRERRSTRSTAAARGRSASTTRASARRSWTASATQDAALRGHVEQRAQDDLQRARWIAFGFVMLFSTTVLSLGMVALERQAGRERARGRQRREYVEALQGADDEGEAKELLRRRAERLTPGAHAVVLTRNASGNSLAASTDPSGIPGLADALVDATPRSCLAIRRAGIHERKPGGAPLQTCELCHRSGGASLCVPSVDRRRGHRLAARPQGPRDQAGRARAGRRGGLAGRPGPRQPAQPRDRRAPRGHRPADAGSPTPAPCRRR